jgi:hypothetical protein
MSEKTSRTILIIEAVLIVLPITVMALIESGILIMFMFQFFGLFYVVALGILALISLAAIVSGWRLFIAFFRGGANNLQKQHFGWWLALLAGVLVLIGSLVSNILPRSPAYSDMWMFRDDFNLFMFASPLLIPLIHLALEKFIRKSTDETTK